MTEKNRNIIETSDEMNIPLPIPENEIKEYYDIFTVEKNGDSIRKLCREANIIPNVKDIQIPIISGITLYSYLRFFNAFSSVTKVDVYVNGKKIASNLCYKSFTRYYKAFPGYYYIQIFKSGKTTKPLFVTNIQLIGYQIYTGAITGIDDQLFFALINDRTFQIPKGKAALRLIQLSPNAPLMDACLDNTLIITEIDFSEVSRYLLVPSEIHILKIRDYINNNILLETAKIKLDEICAYTAYVIGNFNCTNSAVGLEIIIEIEGISFLKF
ncbi:hypothetical protein CLNEO_12140 [Anaerotignum neopropionicum]|uniref:DUF4397 domain-containing protein n=1 Tax=Anaerotignum neopropionicum TaxID=36847 RepID=A0A136WFR8_9FIRM|nr:DUF4397 domain-containing protein [Anaerotignum neopropionicum]KXL53243.1 hypothetical protein CLNEO_12140 [Anaerotignum neopropionicum]